MAIIKIYCHVDVKDDIALGESHSENKDLQVFYDVFDMGNVVRHLQLQKSNLAPGESRSGNARNNVFSFVSEVPDEERIAIISIYCHELIKRTSGFNPDL